MNRQHVVFAVCFTVAPCFAQKTDLSIRPATNSVEYTIESQAEVATERKILVDGEEGGFGGRGGGRGRGGSGGPSKTKQKVVFEEGPAGSKWRHYKTAEATVTRPGRDGEEQTNEVAGGLAGKKLFISEDDGGIVVREGDDKGEPLPRNMINGLPVKVTLAGLAPTEPIEVGEEYDISKGIRSALAGLVHPVTPTRVEGERGGEGRGRRGGGEGGGEGRGGRGGGEGRGGRGEGGRQAGGRGGRGGFGRGRGTQNAAFSTLTNDKIDWQAVGKLVSVEDGLAVVAINGKLAGEGTPGELGMSGAFGGGRGGRGGRGGGGDEGDAKVELSVQGTLTIRLADHQVQGLRLEGNLKSSSESVRSMGDRELEIFSDTKGSFALEVACRPGKKSDN